LYYPDDTQSEDPLNDSCNFFLTTLLRSIIQTFHLSVKRELLRDGSTEYGENKVVAMLESIDKETARTYNKYMGRYQDYHNYYSTFVSDVDLVIQNIRINLTDLQNL